MRTFWLVTAAAVSASPALAQNVNVVAKQRAADSAAVRRALVERALTAVDLRTLKLKIDALDASNKKIEAQIVQKIRDSTMTDQQYVELTTMIDRGLYDRNSTQSELVRGCAMSRPAMDVEGTLGFHIDQKVEWLLRRDLQGRSLTMVFEREPFIDSIDAGSPAAKAGMRAGDHWVELNGKRILDTVRFDELLTPGSRVTLRVERGGRDVDLPMTVARRETDYPSDVCDSVLQMQGRKPRIEQLKMQAIDPRNMELFFRQLPMFPKGSDVTAAKGTGLVTDGNRFMFTLIRPTMALYAGASIGPLDDEARSLVGMQGDGVVVVDLPQGSAAEIAGLRRFDVITKVNGVAVTSPMAFQKMASNPTLMMLVYHKDQGTRIVTITAPPKR